MAQRKVSAFHVYANRQDGTPDSISYDEFEFNEGIITLEQAVKELVEDKDYRQVVITIAFED